MAYNPGGGQPPFNPQYPYGAAPPPPPPPKSGMGTGAKVALFGCLGVIVLGIIGVVIAAVVGIALNKNSNTIGAGNSNSGSASNSNSSNRNSGSSSSNKNSGGSSSSSSSKVHVDSLDLARDNNGSAGERVSSFKPTDNPMHFVVGLTEFESGTKVKVVLMAVDVATGEKNVKVGEIERETGTLENQMDATMTLPRNWPTGTYRVDVYVGGNLDKSREFEVE